MLPCCLIKNRDMTCFLAICQITPSPFTICALGSPELPQLPKREPGCANTFSKASVNLGLEMYFTQENHRKFESPRVGPWHSQFFPSEKLLDYARLPKAPAHLVPGLPLASLEPFASWSSVRSSDEPKKNLPFRILQLFQIWVRTRQSAADFLGFLDSMHTHIMLPNQQSYFTTLSAEPRLNHSATPGTLPNFRPGRLFASQIKDDFKGIWPVTFVCFHMDLHSKRQPKTEPKYKWHGNRNLDQ